VWSISLDWFGPVYALLAMAALFVLVLLHEFGHVAACRALGGVADDVLLWPLGGLAPLAAPESRRAQIAVALAGPAVNLAILPLTSLGLWLGGAGGTILFNPLAPALAIGELGSWWLVALWWLHAINAALLACNLLAPLPPLDAARVLEAALRPRLGVRRAGEVAATVGLVGAIAVIVFALPSGQTLLVGVGVFCGLVCWQERQRLRAMEELGVTPLHPMRAPLSDEQIELRERRAAGAARNAAAERDEVDRILAKIASGGMESLTRGERKALQRATKQQGGRYDSAKER
jgi:Zn-dependent protease